MSVPSLARADWSIWTCEASLVVTDDGALGEARVIVDRVLDAVDRSCSRFRADSELNRAAPLLPHGALVSPTLARLVEGAIAAAELTDGAVDLTLGGELNELGYTTDLEPSDARAADALRPQVRVARRRSRWREISIQGDRLRVPEGVQLDLGATAKGIAVDLAVQEVVERLGCGVLLGVGGDIATAGPAPDDAWQVLVRDLESDPQQQISLRAGWAIATSSTQKRRWASGGFARHHILDPRSGLPARAIWKSVSVVAASCLEANTMATAAIVLGRAAPAWLGVRGVVCRLVDRDDRVLRLNGWPEDGAEARSAAS